MSEEIGWKPGFTPSPSGLHAEFYAHCARGELRFQRCDDCGTWRHPPRVLCPRCASERWQWARSSGRGTLFSWTITHQPLVPGFGDRVPYAVAVVELEEGPRLVTGLRGIALRDLAIGVPVEVAFEKLSDALGLHYFRPRA
ncbi:MAG TPA: Zn-ribbon domain-containing OB-fold protein [Candidatus Binatia bacterium]|nr:Zn-ribbon domain-containing OB-fold protein [Candidatus Binatia bacterium]